MASASDVGSHLYLSLSLDLVIRSSTFASVSGWQLMGCITKQPGCVQNLMIAVTVYALSAGARLSLPMNIGIATTHNGTNGLHVAGVSFATRLECPTNHPLGVVRC